MDKGNGKVIKAYKGFNQDFKCRDMQYEIGKEYEYDGNINCCYSGFHACENPLDVLDYYNIANSRFAEVELSGGIGKEDGGNDTRLCASKIKVKAELKLADFIKLSVEYLKELVKPKSKDIGSGKGSQLASSSNYSQLASCGKGSQLASSGDYSQLASSGKDSQLASSGYRSVVMAAGYGCKARAKKGSWITLAEWKRDNQLRRYIPICVKTEQVDGERIKEDTWYKLEDGEFKEVSI